MALVVAVAPAWPAPPAGRGAGPAGEQMASGTAGPDGGAVQARDRTAGSRPQAGEGESVPQTAPREERDEEARNELTPAPGAAATGEDAPALAEEEEPSQLDLDGLKERLRETEAIGFFTKLELRSQVNDLLDAFRVYHESEGRGTIAQLHEQYDLLLLKMRTLLQDSDPKLAHAISASRESVWVLLSDPEKFVNL